MPNRAPRLDQEVATIAKDLDLFAGWLSRLENPDPVVLAKGGGKGLKLYDEVLRDAHASAVLQTRYLGVCGKEYEVLPADGSAEAQQIADFVKDAIDAMPFTRGCLELMQGILYGYSVSEVMWRKDGDKWLPFDMVGKHPRRFSFTMERELRMLTPENMIDGEPVPDRKFIVFRWGDTDNPYGFGLGQRIWWPVWFKKNGIKYWMVFLEKFGMPTIVGKYPPGTDKTAQASLLEAIDAIQSDTGIKIPDTMAIELLEASRTGQVSYQELCAYMDGQISKVVLGQNLTTDVASGSLAAAKVHDEVRQEILKADADLLCDTLNSTLIRWIVDLNLGPQQQGYPKLWFRVEPEEDLKALADRDKVLAVDIGLPIGRSYFYDTYGIPEPSDGDDLVGAIREPPPYEPPIKGAPGKTTFSEPVGAVREPVGAVREPPLQSATLFPDQTAIDAVADPDRQVLNPILQPVVAAVREGRSYEDILSNILEQYPDMKSADAERLLERAIFTAELWGRLNA